MSQQVGGAVKTSLPYLDVEETRLIAICGGLLVLIWLLLGKIGLILIGVIGGVALHSWWMKFQGLTPDASTSSSKREEYRESGIKLVNRLISWQTKRRPATPIDQLSDKAEVSWDPDHSGDRSATTTALAAVSDAIIQQYVEWWYQPILPSRTAFPSQCRNSLVRFIRSISSHLARKRPAEMLLHFLTNSSSIIIVYLGELASALDSETAHSPYSTAESIRAYLQGCPESPLSNLLSAEKQQEKLGVIATDILQMFVDPQLFQCDLTKTFFCEMVSGAILEPMIKNCSKPEYINRWIVHFLEQGEPELINALDAGLEQASKKQTTAAPTNDDSSSEKRKYIPRGGNADGREHNFNKDKAEAALGNARSQTNLLRDMTASENVREENKIFPLPAGDVGNKSGTVFPDPSEESSTPVSIGVPIGQVHDDRRDNPSPADAEANHSIPIMTKQDEDGINQRHRLDEPRPPVPGSGTLRNAEVSLIEGFGHGEDATLRAKPSKEYLLQVEPKHSPHQGWMVARLYTDFEALHEVLHRISVTSGLGPFVSHYQVLPTWQGKTHETLRRDLEQYIRCALRHNHLADSQGMSSFLDKSRGSGSSSTGGSNTTSFVFPNQAAFETMGKGVLDVLASAPKGVTGGGKAVIEGVAGVFGGAGPRRGKPIEGVPARQRRSGGEGFSNENVRTSNSREPICVSSNSSMGGVDDKGLESEGVLTSAPEAHVTEHSVREFRTFPHGNGASPIDGHGDTCRVEAPPVDSDSITTVSPTQEIFGQPSRTPELEVEGMQPLKTSSEPPSEKQRGEQNGPVSRKPHNNSQHVPFSEDEVMMAVELLFAVMNEMYSLSSVWTIRKALLNAAKSYLLRPGNPNLEFIRDLIQKSITEHTSDDALAGYIDKFHDMFITPTEESHSGHHQLSDDEKEDIRVKARRLLIAKGMPQAVSSVMGTSTTTDVLGQVFDSLQIESVTRGLIFTVFLQALKVVLQ